jgi:Ser/Thr protein kinase RdoA (MazF antagonist)
MPASQAAQIARRHYGVVASARRLASEHDDTFRLILADGSSRFLRVSPPDPGPAGGVSFLTAILAHLAATAPGLPVQRVIRSRSGAPEVPVPAPGAAGQRIARMTTFLEGRLLGDVPSSPGLRRDIGATLAALSQALRRFTHPAAQRTHQWDLRNAPALRAALRQLPDGGPGMDAGLRGQLLAVADRFCEVVRPALAATPVQVIHADFHGDNLLADGARITGVLDFGDSLTGPVAMDVAVAACYQLGAGGEGAGASADLLGPALDVVAGYHAVDPLRPADLPLIAELIAVRLATRIIISQRNAAREPANAGYLLRKTPQAIEHFAAFRAIGARAVTGRLATATGMEAIAMEDTT